MDLDSLVRHLDLRPHPEGGFFRETFRSPIRVRSDRADVERAAVTQILYALPAGGHSAWHRVAADELWQHHAGAPLDLHVLVEGRLVTTRLGDVLHGHAPQAVVPRGAWQAARVPSPGPPSWALCGCTVAPGFEFEDFVLADADTVETLAASLENPALADLVRGLGPTP